MPEGINVTGMAYFVISRTLVLVGESFLVAAESSQPSVSALPWFLQGIPTLSSLLPPLLWQHPFVCLPKPSLLLPRTLLQFSVPSCGWDRVVPLLSLVFPCSCISCVTGTSSKGVSPVPSLPLIYFFVFFCTKWILTPIGAVVIKSELPTTIFWLFS